MVCCGVCVPAGAANLPPLDDENLSRWPPPDLNAMKGERHRTAREAFAGGPVLWFWQQTGQNWGAADGHRSAFDTSCFHIATIAWRRTNKKRKQPASSSSNSIGSGSNSNSAPIARRAAPGEAERRRNTFDGSGAHWAPVQADSRPSVHRPIRPTPAESIQVNVIRDELVKAKLCVRQPAPRYVRLIALVLAVRAGLCTFDEGCPDFLRYLNDFVKTVAGLPYGLWALSGQSEGLGCLPHRVGP
jgi:hypothetical protein